jgi:hypothetical protein
MNAAAETRKHQLFQTVVSNVLFVKYFWKHPAFAEVMEFRLVPVRMTFAEMETPGDIEDAPFCAAGCSHIFRSTFQLNRLRGGWGPLENT